MSDRYRIPKHKARVRIRTSQTREEQVFLFLAERAESHGGCERPVDLFYGPDEFLVVEAEDGEVSFLRRSSLTLVSISVEDELAEGMVGSEPVDADLDLEQAVTVLLEDGLVLTGLTRYQLPEAQSRLQDFLNASEPFLPLYQGDEIVLINKSRIARVTPI